jgi:hypothetical protein
MRKYIRFVAIGALSLVPLLSTTSCSSKKKLAEKVISGPSDVKVKEDGSVEVRAEGGSMVTGKNKVPKDFPDGVPLPKGKVAETFSATTGGKKSWMVATEVDSVQQQTEAMSKALKASGYKIDSELNQSNDGIDTSMVVATKGKSTVLVQGESSSDKPAKITVMVSQE